MGDWCNLALGKDHPKGFPSLFFSTCRSLRWQRQDWLTWLSPVQNGLDSTYSEVTKRAWPVLRSEETTRWRSENSTMSILASAEVEQKWVWRAKQLRARSLIPVTHCLEGLPSEELDSGAVCLSTAEALQLPGEYPVASQPQKATLCRCSRATLCQTEMVKGFLPKARSWSKLHININTVTTVSKQRSKFLLQAVLLRAGLSFWKISLMTLTISNHPEYEVWYPRGSL